MRAIATVALLCGAGTAALNVNPAARPAVAFSRRTTTVRCSELPQGWREVSDDSGKAYYYNAATGVSQWQRPVERFVGANDDSNARDLTPASTWKIKLDLTVPGEAKLATISASMRFAPEEGYEPPQGYLRVESCVPEGALRPGQQEARWQLSEDPEDRGDSLWIWGLFKEPLYPFILFELELPEPLEVAEGKFIPAGKLYCQVDHRRKDGQVQLGDGTVTYKVTEKIAADLVGLSAVEYGEPIECGNIRFLDTADEMRKSYV